MDSGAGVWLVFAASIYRQEHSCPVLGRMLAFLQGLAYGLLLSCPAWFVVGMLNPSLAIPNDPPLRWHVVFRYWFAIPTLAILLWLTSLWGGFGPSLMGWLAGLAAIPVSLPLERGLRRWRRRRQAAREARNAFTALTRRRQREAESALQSLSGAQPPDNADDLVMGLWRVRGRLTRADQQDLAVQVDRVYTRYDRLKGLLRQRFDPTELTYERSTGLVADVCRGALDTLERLAGRAEGLQGMDPAFVRRRLSGQQPGMPAEEREALAARQALIEQTRNELAAGSGRLEAMLTALDDATLAIGRLETSRPAIAVDAQRALDDLRRFAERSGQYDHSRKG